jgi:hypothetical protein
MSNAVNLSALGSNGGTSISTWTTATRPSSPIVGQTGFNTTLGSLESYNGSAWVSGGGLNIQSVQTTGFTAVAGNIYPCNTTSAAFTVTLPASPTAGNQVQIIDYAGTFATNNVTLGRNGLNITGAASNYLLQTNREAIILTYIDATQGWVVSSAAYTTAPLTSPDYSVQYLVIAGGGSGGTADDGGGGGGAGGYRCSVTGESSGGGGSAESPLTVIPGTSYTVTIGAGGVGVLGSPGTGTGNDGSNSVFGSITSVAGGGAGGISTAGRAGGSGGGGGQRSSLAGGAGTSGQGYAGGIATTSAGGDAGGGGGGAGSVGQAAPSSSAGGNGGSGVSSSINGSATTRAGGGGGGGLSSSGSASGGGGAGAASTSSGGSNGTANTGGGGGGSNNHSALSGSGGSGLVIVRYLGSQRGTGGTVTSSGGYTIHTFTSSGTYTA